MGLALYWYVPPTPGIWNSYWIRCTQVLGLVSSGTLNTWQQLNVSRQWSKTNVLILTAAVVLRFDIASDALGSNIVATTTVTLDATVNLL